jgi:hypothetical protein
MKSIFLHLAKLRGLDVPAQVCVCMYTCMLMHMYMHSCACLLSHTCKLRHMYTETRMYTCNDSCVLIYMCMSCHHTHAYVVTYIHMHMHSTIHIHVNSSHIYTHGDSHAHVHGHTCFNLIMKKLTHENFPAYIYTITHAGDIHIQPTEFHSVCEPVWHSKRWSGRVCEGKL